MSAGLKVPPALLIRASLAAQGHLWWLGVAFLGGKSSTSRVLLDGRGVRGGYPTPYSVGWSFSPLLPGRSTCLQLPVLPRAGAVHMS